MKNIWVLLVIVVVIVGGGYWWMQSQVPATSDIGPAAETGTDLGVQQAPMPVIGSTTPEMIVTPAVRATVTYDGSSFSPGEVTIKKGGKVTFNSTSGEMWVASGPHPQHTNYAGTALKEHCAAGAVPSFDQCVGGTSYTFTFDKVGTWPYHNHVNLGIYGKVIVVE